MKTTTTRATVVAVALALSALALAACGSNDTGSSTAAEQPRTNAGSTDVTYFQNQLAKLYKGTFATPTGPAVKAPTGKTIWVDSAGQGISASVLTTDAIKQAAEKLGWKVNIYDSKFDPTRMLTGVQQALAAKADGIIMLYVDCSIVKTGLQQAKAAGVPVVGIEAQDCKPSLMHTVQYVHHQSFDDIVTEYGKAQATWVIAKTNGRAKTILDHQTDSHSVRLGYGGVKSQFAKCSTCKIVGEAAWVGADLGPKLQAKVQQQLIKHPDANSYITSYDASMTQGGVATALKASGRLNKMDVMGGEGSAAGIDQIRRGTGMQACAGEDVRMEGYAAVDGLVRDFLKRDPSELDSGIGIQVCDKDRNLPPEGQAFTPQIDYPPVFYKLWGVG
jgi:ribose transport system substrate-binding protein